MKLSLKKSRGFTLVELLKVLFWFGFLALTVVVIAHFLIKFW